VTRDLEITQWVAAPCGSNQLAEKTGKGENKNLPQPPFTIDNPHRGSSDLLDLLLAVSLHIGVKDFQAVPSICG
jgi:hypothetical protein